MLLFPIRLHRFLRVLVGSSNSSTNALYILKMCHKFLNLCDSVVYFKRVKMFAERFYSKNVFSSGSVLLEEVGCCHPGWNHSLCVWYSLKQFGRSAKKYIKFEARAFQIFFDKL